MKNIIKKIFPKHISKQELEYKIIEANVKLEREREFYKKSQIQSNVRLNQVLKSNEQLNKDILNLKSQLEYKLNPPLKLMSVAQNVHTFKCHSFKQEDLSEYQNDNFENHFKRFVLESLSKDLFNYVKIEKTYEPYQGEKFSCEIKIVVDKESEDQI